MDLAGLVQGSLESHSDDGNEISLRWKSKHFLISSGGISF